MPEKILINIGYLAAACLFITGLKGLSHPRTAVRGNLRGALGMLVAVIVTLIDHRIIGFRYIVVGLIIGLVIGVTLACTIKMTAMPQMVAIFNGLGGGASVLVAAAAIRETIFLGQRVTTQFSIAIAVSGLIGAVTFTGSLVAFDKLQQLLLKKNIRFKGQRLVNAILAIICLAIGSLAIIYPDNINYYWLLIGTASLLGVLLVGPIGGADMPVIIALLNSYSGLAAAATGFVLNNNVLIVAGSLVGASGIILTRIMCRAMNRSLYNVMFGVSGSVQAVTLEGEEIYEGKIKSTSAEELAMLFESALRVVIAPGYGMAVSQAQHAVKDLMNLLEAKGVKVEFAIHPVAGRMPGHMNVLLAEADISYEKFREMDEINPSFDEVDIVLVIGANDVVNPLARTSPTCPIAGMPILDVDKARTVVVIKRSLRPGFAGIANPLFIADNTLMFFGDGKEAVLKIIAAIKES